MCMYMIFFPVGNLSIGFLWNTSNDQISDKLKRKTLLPFEEFFIGFFFYIIQNFIILLKFRVLMAPRIHPNKYV